jgi:uncharacterized protein YutD
MSIGNLIIDRIEKDDNQDALLYAGGFNIRFDQRFLNVLLIFDSGIIKDVDYDEYDLGKYYKNPDESSECELRIDPYDYSIITYGII